ncbi:MAG: cation-translocating P-type ATPase [Bacteroidia bacterium]
MKYPASSLNDVVAELKSSLQGLSGEEAALRIGQFGPNELLEKKKKPLWWLFLLQFGDFMILILAVAAILSIFLGDLTDSIIILVILLVNATVGFILEFRAGKSMEALRKMTTINTQVMRDGKISTLSSVDLVPGDKVILEAGNVVPADIRLSEAKALRIDESSLTGESQPIDKSNEIVSDPALSPADQVNMAFKGTLITNGRGEGIVVATGMNTELGKIAGMLDEKEPFTPLQQRLNKFGKKLSFVILAICALIVILGLLRGEDAFSLILLSISLAVAAIPESLPALITVALAGGSVRLAKKKALVKKLPAVETLGSVTYICSDKTGTLTQNKMSVVNEFAVNDLPSMSEWPFLHAAMALNQDVVVKKKDGLSGESTEIALIEAILSAHSFEEFENLGTTFRRVSELPFDSERKCMSTMHIYEENKFLLITKGASESIHDALNDEEEKEQLKSLSEEWASSGIRVLAYAYKVLDQKPELLEASVLEKDMLFAGIVGMVDPARPEVKKAIEECKTAGIKIVMITGDHPATAAYIAREIGILDETGMVLTDSELRSLSDKDFLEQVEHTLVYARVSPAQKLRIIRALQSKEHFVAMTGDGVNDAPSLKAANIGIAMGINGTDVSKEAANLILLDDNFATIVQAVKEGRRIFDNIRKFVKYILTCNSAELLTILIAPILGMPIPLLPIQILWINLVTDGLPALALAREKAEAGSMKRPPFPATESLFSRGTGIHIVWVGMLMAGVTLATQALALHRETAHWQTMVFTVLSLSQLGHVLAIRSNTAFLFKQGLFSNEALLGAVLLTFVLQMGVVYLPFMNTLFKTQALPLYDLGICLLLSLVVFHAVELEKWIKLKFFPELTH